MHGGWRSAMTQELFRAYAEAVGLVIVDQVDWWGPQNVQRPPVEHDVVSILRK